MEYKLVKLVSCVICWLQEVVDKYGGDVVRLFVLFKAPPEAVIQWDIKGRSPH